MRKDLIQETCAVLYVAAGKEASEPEFYVWERGLADVPDDHAAEIVDHILKTVDLGDRPGPPTPALFLTQRRDYLGLPDQQSWTMAYTQ